MSANNGHLIEMQGITKTFPGTVALDNVDFDLRPGEVHALIGENGAGKSTLIKIIAGIYQPDAGTMRVNGQAVTFRSPIDSIEQRIKVVYQELDLCPNLSVAENVFLGGYPRASFGRVDWKTLYSRTGELLQELGLDIDPHTTIDQLRVAEQQLVEIARALSRQAQILVMDEPTSALSPTEVEKLFALITTLKSRGVGVMYVSHKLDEIYQIADRVTVFRDGQRIVTKPVSETQPHQLVEWMVGREVRDLFPKTETQIGKTLLEVRDVSGGGVQNLNLTVRAGEVVAVFGLMGAGVHTIGRALFGDSERTGTVTLDGKIIKPNSPVNAIHGGLGLLTESRKEDGLVMLLSVKENLSLTALRRFARFSWISFRAEAKAATSYVEQLGIKTPTISRKVRLLSGGNQQKTLIGRWLLQNPKVLILSEPTRGIDVGSKAEIYRLINKMAHDGMGLLVLSTELPEVLGIADRILVVRKGEITGEFSRAEATQEMLMTAATTAEPLAAAARGIN
ncbi:MAG: sugar ABC transporter ATP-binding protein [Burkholderiales bacterium]|nr:sugar ABC transporter ATP-binding protein [Anaerolineae bacterium]